MRLLHLALLLSLASCTAYIPQEQLQPAPNPLSNVPVKPHHHDVQVFFHNELPHEPYYKIRLIEVREPLNEDANELLNALKTKAREEGMDAVQIDDIGKQTGTVFHDGIYAYQRLVGIGIRYRSTIDYMDSLIKFQTVKVWLPGNDDPKQFDLSFNFNGQCTSLKDALADSIFTREIYPYTAFEAAYGNQPGWAYKVTDTTNFLLASKRKEYAYTAIVCNYTYNENGTPLTINISKPASNSITADKIKQRLELKYSEHGLLTKKILYRKNEVEWIELLSYTRSGRLAKTERFKLAGGKKQPLLESSFGYYSIDDLPAPLQP